MFSNQNVDSPDNKFNVIFKDLTFRLFVDLISMLNMPSSD